MIKTDEFRTARNGLGITLFIPDDVEDATEADFTMQAGPGELSADPRPHLQRAITALQDELADIDRCPVHRHRSSTRPTPDGEIGELVERLRRKQTLHLGPPRGRVEASLLNPDGPKAADRLETQAADIARLREALEPFAKIAELREDYNDRPGMLACVPIETCVAARAALATRTDVR